MPADAKLGLLLGICLVIAAAWVYRGESASSRPAEAGLPQTVVPTQHPSAITP